MDLNRIKHEIRKEISMWVGDKQQLDEEFIKERARLFFKHMAEQGRLLDVSEADKKKIINSLCADYLGLGPLQPLMDDEDITEIMINGPFNIYIEKYGKNVNEFITAYQERLAKSYITQTPKRKKIK